MIKAIKDLFKRQEIRYLFVGGLNTGISYAILIVLSSLGVYYLWASTIGFAVSLINSYFCNKYFVFKKKETKSVAEIIRFLIVYGAQYCVSIACLYMLVDLARINVYVSGIINIAVCTLVSYFGHKYFTYK